MRKAPAGCACLRTLVGVTACLTFTLAAPAVSDARSRDRDHDGLTNRFEVRKSHTSPRRADTDRDGLRDGYEVRRSHTNPRRADTDHDGLKDRYELRRSHTNPRRADTDHDGLKDRYELRRSHTNPRRADTDGDGMNDGMEVRLGRDPRVADGIGGAAPGHPGGGKPSSTPPGGGGPSSPGKNCMPNPSACGFPDVDTTGVTPGTTLAPVNGTVTLSTPGQVYENKSVMGGIVVTAPNVTIRNVRITNTAPSYTISVKAGNSWQTSNANLTVDHVEFNLGGYLDTKGIAFNGYTVKNSFFHNGSDCAHFGFNVTIQDSLCVSGPDTNSDGWPDAGFRCQDGPHYDGFQSDGGSNIRLIHNTIRNPCEQTSAILMSTNTSGISNVTIQNNLMAGGGYTLYCNAGPDVANETVTGNRFARTWYARSGYWGATTNCQAADVYSGSVWDDTGARL